jgi:hypothetical protein
VVKAESQSAAEAQLCHSEAISESGLSRADFLSRRTPGTGLRQSLGFQFWESKIPGTGPAAKQRREGPREERLACHGMAPAPVMHSSDRAVLGTVGKGKCVQPSYQE